MSRRRRLVDRGVQRCDSLSPGGGEGRGEGWDGLWSSADVGGLEFADVLGDMERFRIRGGFWWERRLRSRPSPAGMSVAFDAAPSPPSGERAGVRGEAAPNSVARPPKRGLAIAINMRHAPAMSTVSRARRLRREMPDAQRRLWRLLRDRRFAGYKFRREHPMGRYFLDFYCAEATMNVELDGGQHGLPEQQTQDAVKERYLRSRGVCTIRFWNWQVCREPEMVMENLWRLLQERAPHPGNVPTATKARSRTWPGHQVTERVPLRPSRLPSRNHESAEITEDQEVSGHPSPRPSPREGRG